MVLYKCINCDYETKIKARINKHLKNKRPCRTQIVYADKELMTMVGDDVSLLKIVDRDVDEKSN